MYGLSPVATSSKVLEYQEKLGFFQPSTDSTLLISTHLIADVERILDDVVFISRGQLVLHQSVDQIRQERGYSVDDLFREVFRYAE